MSMHSRGNFSDKSTNFVAAAWITISGLAKLKTSLTDFEELTSNGTVTHPVIF